MNVFINGASCISPQNSINYDEFCNEIVVHETLFLESINPEYKEFIKPIDSRRMSKTVKNGIIASNYALREAETEMPDAIIVGTGLGVVSDTEKFLEKMIENNEQFLTPTSFIQSTHNTVAGQIALGLKCHNYNFTYVHGGFSFESAVIDAVMHINEGKKNILVGAADEMTQNYYKIIKKTGNWKTEIIKNTDLFKYQTTGALCGEGVSFFVLSSQKNQNTFCILSGTQTIYKPKNSDEIQIRINEFLSHRNLQVSDIDMVILGVSGDYVQDKIYYEVQNSLFMSKYVTYYKHLSGDFHTSTSFAMWFAANAIKHNKTPDFVSLLNLKPSKIENVLIYNHYFENNHSLFLLTEA